MVVGICASPLLPMSPRVTEALTPMSVLTSGVPVTVPDVSSSATKFVSLVSSSNGAKALFPKGGTCADDWSSTVVPAGTLVNVAVAVAEKSQTGGTSKVCVKVDDTAAPPLIGNWVGAEAGSGPGPKPTVHALGDGTEVGAGVGVAVGFGVGVAVGFGVGVGVAVGAGVGVGVGAGVGVAVGAGVGVAVGFGVGVAVGAGVGVAVGAGVGVAVGFGVGVAVGAGVGVAVGAGVGVAVGFVVGVAVGAGVGVAVGAGVGVAVGAGVGVAVGAAVGVG